ncbi:hypothetical protein [Neptunicoccus cionae]|uniref:hypothetical protein n=1 Tax=Neptunicoccus cionae TaxID=2035344 RepID=UPI00166955A2|nr:hypothetical protein [Amylibacter cionae]
MKTILLSTLLTLAPALSFAAGCNSSHDTAASCPTGQSWDAKTSQCVDQASS